MLLMLDRGLSLRFNISEVKMVKVALYVFVLLAPNGR
jgi:hypothetical protein